MFGVWCLGLDVWGLGFGVCPPHPQPNAQVENPFSAKHHTPNKIDANVRITQTERNDI